MQRRIVIHTLHAPFVAQGGEAAFQADNPTQVADGDFTGKAWAER